MNESDLELLITVRLKNEIQQQLEWINSIDYLSDSDRCIVLDKYSDLSIEAIKFLSLLLSDCKKLEEDIRYTKLRNKKTANGKQYKRQLNAIRLERFIQNMWNVNPDKAKSVRIELGDFVKALFSNKVHNNVDEITNRYRLNKGLYHGFNNHRAGWFLLQSG